MSPSAVLAGVLGLAFASMLVFALAGRSRDADAIRRGSSFLLGGGDFLVHWFMWVLRPLDAAAARLGLGPDAFNLGGLAFGLSALLMFSTSVLYHAARDPRWRLVLRRLDHAAIYLLIAGTYTPFTLGVLRGAWGWSIAGVVWGLAVLGIVFKTTRLGFRYHKTSVLLYVAMGWLVIVAIGPLTRALDGFELGWLFAGGLCYTGGVAFYVWKSRPYTHAVWHLFVLAGVACHFVAVASVTAPG